MALTRNGDPVTVLLDSLPVTFLVPLEIVRSSGGSRLDYARFSYNLAETGERIRNMKTPAEFLSIVEVQVSGTTIFRGRLHRQDLMVASDERVAVTASILPQDFGKPVEGAKYYDKRNDDYEVVTGDILFDPLIDGVIRVNMSDKTTTPENMRVWCDPESVRSSNAETYRGETAAAWEKDEALHSVTRLLMDGVIDPPDVLADPDIIGSTIPLENLRIPFGVSVPDALDAITHPLGFDWYVDPEGSTSQVVVYRRGTGTEKTITMQDVGNVLDLSTTNNHAFRVSVDIGGRANKLRLVGGREQWQLQVELYRGWATADDALGIADLDASDPDSQFDTKRDVWRLWVANEAGDYSGLRDSGVATIPSGPRDWSGFGMTIEKRRPAEDTLCIGDDGQRLPPLLEWSSDGGSTWEPAPRDEWQWSILEDQFGVRFLGDLPPEALHAAGDDARLRLTATVTADSCIDSKVAVTGRDAQVDEPGDVWQVLDVSDRYHYRAINTVGDFACDLTTGPGGTDETDDSSRLQQAAEYMLGEVDSADIVGDLALIGIRTDYKIGDLITEISGRNISLNMRDDTAGVPRYLQVLGVRWMFGDAQETQLITRPQMVDHMKPIRPDGVLYG